MPVVTLSDLVFHVREISGGRSDLLTIREHGRRQPLSTADFLRGVHSLAVALEARGLAQGDRVTIFFENRPEWHIVDFACQLLGVTTVPVSPTLPEQQVGFILRNSASGRVFYGNADQRDLLLGLVPSLTSPPEIVAVDGDAAGPEGISITRLMGQGASLLGDVPIERFRGRAKAGDVASLVYVADASGDPSRIEMSHRQAVSDMLACAQTLDLSPADSALAGLPLSLGFQRTVDHQCFHRGIRVCYVPSLDDVPEALQHERPTLLTAELGIYEWAYRQALDRFPREKPLRRRALRWAVDIGRRHAAARGGFISPLLGLQRKLADRLIFRGCRQILGGRLRRALAGEAAAGETPSAEESLAGEIRDFFAALGVPLIRPHDFRSPPVEGTIVDASRTPR